MRLIILDDKNSVGEWAAKYVLKRIRNFKPGPSKWATDNDTSQLFARRRRHNFNLLNFSDISCWDYRRGAHHWACTKNWSSITWPDTFPSNTWRHSTWTNMSVRNWSHSHCLCSASIAQHSMEILIIIAIQVCKETIPKAIIILCGEISFVISTSIRPMSIYWMAMQTIWPPNVLHSKRI